MSVSGAAQITTDALQGAGKIVAAGAAAALLTLGAATGTALASEFDLRQEPTPTSRYVLDDAGVLSKATKKDLNKRLKALEVLFSDDDSGIPSRNTHLLMIFGENHLLILDICTQKFVVDCTMVLRL